MVRNDHSFLQLWPLAIASAIWRFQKGERRAQLEAAGADLEEWGCSGAKGLQIICRKGKGVGVCFRGNMREGTNFNWVKIWGES